jgi:hypothetical protein
MFAVFHASCTVSWSKELRAMQREVVLLQAQLLDSEMRTVGRFRALAKPQLPAFEGACTSATTFGAVTRDEIESASDFPDVYRLFTEFADEATIVYSYGKGGALLLETMRRYDACTNYAFLLRCKDVRPIFSEIGIRATRFTAATIYLAFEDISDERPDDWPVESIVRSLRALPHF